MFPIDTPNISDGVANHVYSLVEQGKYSTVRRETAAPSDQPATLAISHEETGTGLTTRYNTRVAFKRVFEDASGNQGAAEATLVFRWNPKIVTAANAQKSIVELVSLLAIAGYKDKLTNLEP